MSKRTELYIWGNTETNKVFPGGQGNYCAPRYLMPHLPVKSISISMKNCLYLATTGEVFTSLSPSPQQLLSLKPHKIISISSGDFHSAALSNTGFLFTWGEGESGALGLGDTSDYTCPQKVNLSKITQVSCGAKHTACISSGHLYTWGTGTSGQLGTNNNSKQVFPVKIQIESISEVSCGIQHTLVLKKNGSVISSGANSCGQLGTGNKKASFAFVDVDSDVQFAKIACGSHSAAISTRGELFVWGTGLFGEWLSPKLVVEGKLVKDLCVSSGSGFAITTEENVISWGSNSFGELGLGDYEQRTGFSYISLLKNIKKIFSGNNSVIAIGKETEVKKKITKESNKENLIETMEKEENYQKELERLRKVIENKEGKIKLLESMINEEEISRIQQENEYFRNAFEEMKKFKQQCYSSLTKESEKRKFAESFVKDLHSEHKMLIGTIEDLEKTMSKLSKQCELFQEKASQADYLLVKVKQLTAENDRLKSSNLFQENISKRYTADLSFDSITMASPDISLIFDRKSKKNQSTDKTLRTSKSAKDLLKLFEVPDPIRSISPGQITENVHISRLDIDNDPQTPPTFRDGNIANSGAIKNSLSEIRMRLNLLQENKTELEGKMSDFEKKLREQV